MSLDLVPDTPHWMLATAPALLYAHIAGGAGGLAFGAAALFLRKGAPPHRAAGRLFFVSMLIMAATGAMIAPYLPDRVTTLAGIVTLYLVATGFAAVKRRENRIGRFEIAAFVAALGAAAWGVSLALAAQAGDGTVDGQPAFAGWLMGGFAALGASFDLKTILRRGVAGAARIARHLWRMCAALFIAAASFFLGQQQVLPEWIQDTPALAAPPLAVLALLFYWLVRVRLGKRFRAAPAAG